MKPKSNNRNIYQEILMQGKVWQAFDELCIIQKFKKNEIITPFNSIENYLNIILEGQTGLFHKKGQDSEICFDINYPGEYVSSYGSYINQERSIFEVRAITDTTLKSMSYDSIYNTVYENIEGGKNAGRQVVEAVLKYTQERLYQHHLLSAPERYKLLVEYSKGMILHTPNKYLASFLRITPQTLSKIKREHKY